MGRGSPDWVRRYTITQGAPNATLATISAPSNVETTIVEVAGQGVLYGCLVWVEGLDSRKDDIIRLYLDGVKFADYTWDFLNQHAATVQQGGYPAILQFDDTNFIYSCLFAGGMAYLASLKLTYELIASEADQDVSAHMYYSSLF